MPRRTASSDRDAPRRHRKGVELEPCLQLGPARAKRHAREEAPVVIEDKVERPSSVLRDRMARSELLMRAAVPLKLDPYGSHLSDLARKPVVTTLRRGYTRKKRTMLPNSAKERQFTPVSKERLEDMKPARRKPRKLGQRRRVDKLPPLTSPEEDEPSPKRRPRSLTHKKKRAYVVEQKRRAEAAAYGVATQSPRRRRARRPGQTESLRRDRRQTERHYDKLTSVRRGASITDEDSAFEDSDELAAEAEIAELKAAIAAERAKGGV